MASHAGKNSSRDELTVGLIKAFNEGRDPRGLKLKYERMSKTPLRFFRGTAHLFWGDWPRETRLDIGPMIWSTGDLHVENFGAYKIAPDQASFDLNDFDEAAMAPASRDATRLVTSVMIGLDAADGKASDPKNKAKAFLESWLGAFEAGDAGLERTQTPRLIEDLLRVSGKPGLPQGAMAANSNDRLFTDSSKSYAGTKRDVVRATALLEGVPELKLSRDYDVLDVVARFAGTGSCGVERYQVLLRARKSTQEPGLRILDIKLAAPSSLAQVAETRQPEFTWQAQRVIAGALAMQRVKPLFVAQVTDGPSSFVVKDLQPEVNKLVLDGQKGLKPMFEYLGALLAHGQLKAAGVHGKRSDLAALAHTKGFSDAVLDYAHGYASLAQADWAAFCRAYKQGAFASQLPKV